MSDAANSPYYDDDEDTQFATLQRDIARLVERGQDRGLSLYEVAVMLITAGCHALGHAVGDTPPPEGPELIQEVLQQLQHEAEVCYFQHWD